MAMEPISRESHEFSSSWRILLAATLGISMATTAIPFYSMGVFIAPLEQAHGWSRSEIAMAATVFGFSLPVSILTLGWMIGRFGVRLVGTFGHVMLGVAYLCLSQMGHNVHVFWALYVFAALSAIGASPITYTRAIIHVFNHHRGLAIGVAMSGTGLGAAFAPPLLDHVIRVYGWQAGYQLLALILFTIAGAVFLLFRGTAFDSRKTEPFSQSGEPATKVQNRQLLTLLLPICLAIFIISLSINGYIIHLIPILTGAGLTSQQAAGLTAFIGVSVILGRLVTGYMLDRFPTGLIGCLIFFAAACGIYMLRTLSAETVLIPILLIGFTIGAEVDIVAYLVSRLFPQQLYARYFSWVYCAFMLGAGISPLIAAYIYDRNGSYGVFFLFSIVALLSISFAFLGLHFIQQRFKALQFA